MALVAGPVLTGVGAYLMKDSYEIVGSGGGYMAIRESGTTTAGKIICAAGIATTLTSIPFFIAAGKAKREARLMMRDESTTYLGKRISVPGISLQIRFWQPWIEK